MMAASAAGFPAAPATNSRARVLVLGPRGELTRHVGAHCADGLPADRMDWSTREYASGADVVLGVAREPGSHDWSCIVFLGPVEAQVNLVRALSRLPVPPPLCIPGAHFGRAVLDQNPGYPGRILTTAFGRDGDATSEDRAWLAAFRKKHGLKPAREESMFAALGSARFLVALLREAGRDVSREAVARLLRVAACTGPEFAPRIQFGGSRQSIASNVSIVAFQGVEPRSSNADTPPTSSSPPDLESRAPGRADRLVDRLCPGEELVASVAGLRLLRPELEARVASALRPLAAGLLSARTGALTAVIHGRLLDKEARVRGVSSNALLKSEAESRVKPPDPAEVLEYYRRNREQLPWEFSSIEKKLSQHLLLQRRRDALDAFASELQARAAVSLAAQGGLLDSLSVAPGTVVARVDGVDVAMDDLDHEISGTVEQIEMAAFELCLASAREWMGPNGKSVAPDAEKTLDGPQKNGEGVGPQQLGGGPRGDGSARIWLRRPKARRHAIAVEGRPSRGSRLAKVTLVEFVDYQCGRCAELHEDLTRLLSEHPDDVRCVTFNLPLSQHPDAILAALAALAAESQGRHWEFSGVLFGNRESLGPADIGRHAVQLGMKPADFERGVLEDRFWSRLVADRLEAARLGVMSTPSVFINGIRQDSVRYADLKSAIRAAIASPPEANPGKVRD